MAVKITADLQRVDRAIRPGVSHRALLKSGSVEAWNACLSSLREASQILMDSSFADQNSSAATCIHWRKSGTSKQLLGLLRAAVDEAPSSARAASCVRECALHVSIHIICSMFERTQSGALWPALREWIVDQGGFQAIWQALAWSMALVYEDKAAHDTTLREPAHAVIGLLAMPDRSHCTRIALPQSAHPSIIAAMNLLLSDLLPRDLASGNAHGGWRLRDLLGHVLGLCEELRNGGSHPYLQLHRAFLVAWPHLLGWFRQQPGLQGLEHMTVLDGAAFLTLLSRRNLGSLPAYWARHFACALDVFELLTADFQHWQIAMGGGAWSSNVLFPYIKQTLHELMSQEYRPALGTDPRAARQLWGLTVRSEQALRATAPLWPAQQAAWGEAADLLANVARPASWLDRVITPGGALLLPASACVPLTRLLLSCAATELKAARVAGLQPASWVFFFMEADALRDSSAALSPAVVSLLLPRMASSVPSGSPFFACEALVFVGKVRKPDCGSSLSSLLVLTSCHAAVILSRTVAEVTTRSQATHPFTTWAVMALASYATQAAQSALLAVQQWSGPLPPGVRARLAQPIMMLLRSPLLGLLASLQHVVVGACAWRFPVGSAVLPVHLLPEHLEPDAVDSKLAMQGRYLAVTLLYLAECMKTLAGGSERCDAVMGVLAASVNHHVKTMWEANCSCRTAGYPEGSVEVLNTTRGDSSTCSGLPSSLDVPTRSQAAARESAAELLLLIRQLAGLLWPDHPAAVSSYSNGTDPASYADWEVLQAELLELPSPSQPACPDMASSPRGCSWGEALWCFNPACTNMSGPSELALKTLACGGGCGVRYCGPECQAQGWRDGHRLSCGQLRERRAARVGVRVQ